MASARCAFCVGGFLILSVAACGRGGDSGGGGFGQRPDSGGGGGEDLIDPSTDPDGVLDNITVAGGVRIEGEPPTPGNGGSGTAPTITSGGTSAGVTAGQTVDIPLGFSDPEGDLGGCIITVAGASGYILVSGYESGLTSGTVTLTVSVGASIGSGSFECVYGLQDDAGGTSSYSTSSVAVTNTGGGGDGDFDCGDGTAISADQVCNGNPQCGNGADEDPTTCADPESCCAATDGCPGETGSSCAESCCCCGPGEACTSAEGTCGPA